MNNSKLDFMQLLGFKSFLENKGFTNAEIADSLNAILHFTNWKRSFRIEDDFQVSVLEFVDYIHYLENDMTSENKRKEFLRYLNIYFRFLNSLNARQFDQYDTYWVGTDSRA